MEGGLGDADSWDHRLEKLLRQVVGLFPEQGCRQGSQ